MFYEGFRIGQVGKIEPERTDKGVSFKVELSVRKDWPIPKDSIARMTSTGLLADVAIGITEGISKEAAPPGSELRGAESADIFAAMNELAGQITILTRDQIAPLIKNLSQHVDSIASVIDKNTPELVEQSKVLLSRLNVASDSMNDLLKPENRAALSAMFANMRDLTKELKTTQQKLDDALTQLDSIAKENRPGVRDSVDDLRAITGGAVRPHRIDHAASGSGQPQFRRIRARSAQESEPLAHRAQRRQASGTRTMKKLLAALSFFLVLSRVLVAERARCHLFPPAAAGRAAACGQAADVAADRSEHVPRAKASTPRKR